MTTVSAAMKRLDVELRARPDKPSDYVDSGMAPNAAHLAKLSYHNSARDNHFAWGGYSMDRPEDRRGGTEFPDLCAAWDLHWGPAHMILVTNRLIASCKDVNDHRLDFVAEVAGTTNGKTVHAYYNNTKTDDPNNTGGWDDGHLTHNHVSFKRDTVDNYDALKGILDVICGVPLQTEEFTVAQIDDIMARFDAIDKRLNLLDTKIQYGDPTHPQGLQHIGRKVDASLTALHVDPKTVK